ncbi:MAG: MFS transporter [Pseudorhodoplanes sp.]
MTAAADPSVRRSWAPALRVATICALITMVSQFYRNAHVVVAPDIMRDVGVSAQVLGLLSGALFVTAAILQIPAGILLDRYGPRRTIPFMLLTVVAGSLLFATAQGGTSLVLGRICMGFGVAAIGMAAIVATTRWYPAAWFATVVGVLLGLSQIGNLSATVPMALLSAEIGWRNSYLAVSGITAVLALASALFVRDAPDDHPFHTRTPETLAQAWRGVLEVLAIRDLWPLLVIAGAAFAMISCILGLWGGPFLYDMHGLDTTARGSVIFWLAAGMIVGNFTLAPLDRILNTRKRIIVACGLGTTCVLTALALQPRMPVFAVTVAFALIGAFSGYTIVIIAHGRSFYPDRLMGRGVTIVNTAVLAGAGALQGLTGLIAGVLAPGATSLTERDYSIIFATLAAVLALALFVYRHCPDKPPNAEPERDGAPGIAES